MSDAPTAPELLSVEPPQWDRALRYLSVVRRLSESSARTRSEVAASFICMPCWAAIKQIRVSPAYYRIDAVRAQAVPCCRLRPMPWSRMPSRQSI